MIRYSIVALISALLTYFCRYLPAPFIGVFLLWFFVFLWMSVANKKAYIKVVNSIIAIIFLVMGIFEIYYWKIATTPKIELMNISNIKKNTPRPSIRIVGKRNDRVPHEIYGYASRKNASNKVTTYVNDRVLYDITVSTTKDGLRVSPEPRNEEAEAILFFGDSYTFGSSVSDDEAMPYVTGMLTDRSYAIYNFGLGGHGPQLMLAQIEHGMVDSIVKHSPKYVIYQVINDNIIRLRGLRGWLINGPQYVMNKKGEIISSPTKKLLAKMHAKLRRSYFYKELYRSEGKIQITTDYQFHDYLSKNEDDSWGEGDEKIDMKLIKTFAALVDKSRNLLESKYPGIEFHVIYWNNIPDLGTVVIEELKIKGIITHKITDILPANFQDSGDLYAIPYDGHPTPLAHKIVANYVVSKIINQ